MAVKKVKASNKLKMKLVWLAVLIFALGLGVNYAMKQDFGVKINSKAASELLWSDDLTNISNLSVSGVQPEANLTLFGKNKVLKTTNTSVVRRLFPETSRTDDGIIKVWFYDDINTVRGSFASIRDSISENSYNQVSLGVHFDVYPTTYFARIGSKSAVDIDTHIPRTTGWHELTFVVTPGGAYGMIDGVSTAYLPAKDINNPQSIGFTNAMTFANNLMFVSTWSAGNGYFHDLRAYKSANSEYPGDLKTMQYMLDAYLRNYPTDLPEVYFTEAGNSLEYDPLKWMGDSRLYSARINLGRALVSGLIFSKTGNQAYLEQTLNSYQFPVKYYGNWLVWKQRYNVADLSLIYGTWLNWNNLNNDLKYKLFAMISNEVNYFASTNPRNDSGVASGDSAAEENAWTANFLWAAAKMFPESPNSKLWLQKANQFAFHSLTRPPGESFAGLLTQTLNSNLRVVNHGLENPHYQYVTLGNLSNVLLTAKKIGSTTDPVWKHNLNEVYETILPFVNFDTGLYSGLQMPKELGGKDDWGLDASGVINSIYYAQKNELPGYQQAYDKLMRHMWYFDRDFLNLPTGGYVCHKSTACTPAEFKNIKIFNQEENSVIAAERIGLNMIFADENIELANGLKLPTNYQDYPAIANILPIPTGSIDRITGFIQDTKIPYYRGIRHNPGSVKITRWNENLADGKKVNLYFYDEMNGYADNTPKGANFGIQFDSNTNGLTFEIRSTTGSSLDKCAAIVNKGSQITRCYLMRIGSQAAANEKNTGIPRTKGWHKITFYKSGSEMISEFDGVFTYKTPGGANPTLFLASSNWSTPTYMEYVITKTDN